MLLLLPPIRLILILACLAGFAYSQTGNLTGTVTDTSGRSVLVGAKVEVEGAPYGATTEATGRYILVGIPAGKARVTVSYLGMEATTRELTVNQGETSTVDFQLSPETVKTSVNVTSSPDLVGQARALNDQQNSLNLVNIVASDQIGSFPDPNAAEAVQRVPGVVVQRDQGEGRYVLIRGTEPRLSATTINGERIGTTENTSRQIPLDTIPADLMGALEVTKVMTPDMEADSIGGRVNLVTKRAPAARHVSLTLGTGFNTLVDRDIKNYSGTYGQRLLNGKLGFIASGNYYQNNRGSQDLEPAYTNLALSSLDMRDYELTRTRKGGTWDVDYRLRPGSEIFLRGLRTEYEDSELRHRLRDIVSSGRMERLLRDRYHDSNQTAVVLGGTHTLAHSALLNWRGSFTHAVLETPWRLEGTYRQTGVTFAPNVTTTSVDPNNIQANPQNQNLSAFSFIQNAIQNDRGNERNLSGGFDLAVPGRFGNRAAGQFKLGLKIRDANRTRDVASATQTPASGFKQLLGDSAQAGYTPPDNYLGGKYSEFGNLFPDPDNQQVLSRSSNVVTAWSPTGDSGSYRATERVTGGYVMEELSLGERTTLLPGVRFEATQARYGAPVYQLGSGGKVLSRTFTTGSSDYLNVMPGVHLRHELFRDTPLRVSFSRTLARPNYNDLAPFVLQDTKALTISRGNPDLKVTTSNNVDVSLEHYFRSIGIASAGFFYKNLSHYIYQSTLQQSIGSDLYRISQPINGDKGNLYGFELTLVRQLDFLPSALAGFGVYTNYTHVSSDAVLPRGSSVLPGQADNMGNASLTYERKGFFSRVSFNYQGHYILAIGATPADDNWLDNRLEIDFSASQRIGKRIRVFIDLLNLGNEPYRVHLGASSDRPLQQERYKMWAICGLKLDF